MLNIGIKTLPYLNTCLYDGMQKGHTWSSQDQSPGLRRTGFSASQLPNTIG